ncbi:helix-turn-helix transcriptional regulator [Pseudonocardia lacus]|uniref:helix-turn-helix transcriptional regulator n=1 Tax=Pseudonocardia lacus TaxID=2835865 RepID=UPI0027E35C14|nr:transcriptional regulator [Pseudonocardia lacus]
MSIPDDLGDLRAVAALTDDVRRAAYHAVASAGSDPVGRDEVAAALGVGRTLAAFHLDKLVDAGLLEASYARRSGRTGPGAGRPAKLYRTATQERAVSVPPRAYRSAAALLAEAVERSGAEAVLHEVSYEHGQRAGTGGPGTGDPDELLAAHGYHPVASDDRIELRNCPFHRLAAEFPPVVCGMNLALVEGLLAGAGMDAWTARMDAGPGRCCVTVQRTKNKTD